MKTLKASVLLMAACESGMSPTEPAPLVECKAGDTHLECRELLTGAEHRPDKGDIGDEE